MLVSAGVLYSLHLNKCKVMYSVNSKLIFLMTHVTCSQYLHTSANLADPQICVRILSEFLQMSYI